MRALLLSCLAGSAFAVLNPHIVPAAEDARDGCSEGLNDVRNERYTEAVQLLNECAEDAKLSQDRRILARYLMAVAYFKAKDYSNAHWIAEKYLQNLGEGGKKLLTPEMLKFIDYALTGLVPRHGPPVSISTFIEPKAGPGIYQVYFGEPEWVPASLVDVQALEVPLPGTFREF